MENVMPSELPWVISHRQWGGHAVGHTNATQRQPVCSGSPIPTYVLVDPSGQPFTLAGASFTIGRAPGNDLVVDEESVARRHARLVCCDDGRWLISDLGTPVGTFVNGERVTGSQSLVEGDEIELGEVVHLIVGVRTASSARRRRARVPIHVSLSSFLAGRIDVAARRRQLQAAVESLVKQRRGSMWIAGVLGAVVVLLIVVIAAAFAFSGSGSDARVLNPGTAASRSVDGALPFDAGAPLDSGRTTDAGAASAASVSNVLAAASDSKPPSAAAKSCVDDSIFYGDITVPDGESFYPGEPITKTWRLQNKGTCAWGADYGFRFVSGNAMGAAVTQTVPVVAPGRTGDVTVVMAAPRKVGDYVGTWQLVNELGQSFGWTVAVKVHIALPPTATPSPTPTKTPTPTRTPTPTKTPTPGPDIHLWSDQQNIPAGSKTTLHVQVKDAAAAWLDGETVVGGRMDLDIAPCFPTTYTLDVQMKDGTHGYTNVPINVVGACATPAPNLVVDYALSPANPKGGKPSALFYSVVNQGDGRTIGFDLVFSVGITAMQTITLERTLSLSPGEQITATRRLSWSPAGVYSTTLAAVPSDTRISLGDNSRRARFIEVK
jgi:pSer/pThr/pTyr-binding forkhead associated (FHA) protein